MSDGRVTPRAPFFKPSFDKSLRRHCGGQFAFCWSLRMLCGAAKR
jgi:hypothetical protein